MIMKFKLNVRRVTEDIADYGNVTTITERLNDYTIYLLILMLIWVVSSLKLLWIMSNCSKSDCTNVSVRGCCCCSTSSQSKGVVKVNFWHNWGKWFFLKDVPEERRPAKNFTVKGMQRYFNTLEVQRIKCWKLT